MNEQQLSDIQEAILIENDKYEEQEDLDFLYKLNEGESNELVKSSS